MSGSDPAMSWKAVALNELFYTERKYVFTHSLQGNHTGELDIFQLTRMPI